MPRYHNTTDGPKKCSASIRNCPLGGKHYDRYIDAQEAFEKEMTKKNSSMLKGLKKNSFSQHAEAASKRIKKLSKELSEREGRQFKDTIYQQLLNEGITEDRIKEISYKELINTEAGIGYLEPADGEDEIIGVSYVGDYRYEEEEGSRYIFDGLESGSFTKDDVVYIEDSKGVGALLFKGSDFVSVSGEEGKNNLSKALNKLNKVGYSDYKRRWELEKKSATEVKDEAHSLIGKKFYTKQDAINGILSFESGNSPKTPQGEFHNGKVLVIASDNAVMKKLMKKAKESHDSGNLRMGSSSNPFSRGVVFYDQRDIGPEFKRKLIEEEEFSKAASEYIFDVKAKLEEKGSLYAIKTGEMNDDVRETKYFINYSPKGAKQEFGWFTREELIEKFDL